MGPMSNMYDRLVAGEDLRTEALANLLERVLAGDQERHTRRFGEFVSRVLLADVTAEQEWMEFVRWMNDSAANLSVVTQYRIDDGTVPDMVLFNGGDPVCVVEVKIDAPIGENQLEGYGRWLAEKANNRYRPALVLLTHVTAPPPGFERWRVRGFDRVVALFRRAWQLGGYARIYSLQELLDGDGRLGNGLKNWSHGAFEKTVSLWNAVFG